MPRDETGQSLEMKFDSEVKNLPERSRDGQTASTPEWRDIINSFQSTERINRNRVCVEPRVIKWDPPSWKEKKKKMIYFKANKECKKVINLKKNWKYIAVS